MSAPAEVRLGSVDGDDEQPRAGGRDGLVILRRRLALIGRERALHRRLVVEPHLGNPEPVHLTAVGGGDETAVLGPLQAGDGGGGRHVFAKVVRRPGGAGRRFWNSGLDVLVEVEEVVGVVATLDFLQPRVVGAVVRGHLRLVVG